MVLSSEITNKLTVLDEKEPDIKTANITAVTTCTTEVSKEAKQRDIAQSKCGDFVESNGASSPVYADKDFEVSNYGLYTFMILYF